MSADNAFEAPSPYPADPALDDLTVAQLYNNVRERVSALLSTLDPELENAPVPATPGWTVHDLVAHFAGLANDVVRGNLDGIGTAPWTSAQVLPREGLPLEQLISEWAEQGSSLEALLPTPPRGPLRDLVYDILIHEHDLRGAVAQPGGRDSLAMRWAWRYPERFCANRIDAAGIAPLRLHLVSDTHTVRNITSGSGTGGASLRTTEFEAFRMLTGRRSAAQILNYEWEGDPTPYLLVVSPFGPLPAQDVIETT